MKRLIPILFTISLAGCLNAPDIPQPIPENLYTATPPPNATDLPPTSEPPQIQSIVGTPDPSMAQPVARFAPQHVQLTEAGCCTQPFWSQDGRHIMFVDRPDSREPAAIYRVPAAGGQIERFTETPGLPGPELNTFITQDSSGQAVIFDAATGDSAVLPTEGRQPIYSPDGSKIAWQVVPVTAGNFDQRRIVVRIYTIATGETSDAVTLIGGGLVGWLDSETLLVGGVDVTQETAPSSLFTVSLNSDERVDFVQNRRVRLVSIAPGGGWISYMVALNQATDDWNPNGLWVVSRDGLTRFQLDVFGSAQWRDERHMLIVPLEMNVDSHRLLQFDTRNGQIAELVTPGMLPFKVGQGDWKVSPTGERIVYLDAEDRSLWTFDLPPLEAQP